MDPVNQRKQQRAKELSLEERERLRREAIDNLVSDTKETASDIYKGVGNFASFLKENPKSAVLLGGMFAPGAATVESAGGYSDPFKPGEKLPSMAELLRGGEYFDASLLGLGVAGDAVTAATAGIPGVNLAGLAFGSVLKLPKSMSTFVRGIKNANQVADQSDEARQFLKFDDLEDSGLSLEMNKDGSININDFEATKKGEGYGSAMLDRVIERSDELGIPLTLYPRAADGAEGLDQDALEAFFRRRGFRFDVVDEFQPEALSMTRVPRVGKTPSNKPAMSKDEYDQAIKDADRRGDDELKKSLTEDRNRFYSTDKPPMTEKQYNAAIGEAARSGDKARQQELIEEKNKFFAKKEKKAKEVTTTARDKARHASGNKPNTPGILQRYTEQDADGYTQTGTMEFGGREEGIEGLIRHSTPTTRALVNMNRPKGNLSGDALLQRLKISSYDEGQSGIRSLIDELGGLDDPNFIGGEGARFSYDEFLEQLKDYGPERNVLRHTDPEYANMQTLQLEYPEQSRVNPRTGALESDPLAVVEGTDFSIAPHMSRGLSNNHRFVTLHTHEPNLGNVKAPGSHRHYNYTEGGVTDLLGPGHNILSHSRGGVYKVTNAKNADDVGHFTVMLDEFQTDGFRDTQRMRGMISPERITVEINKLKSKIRNFENKASEINTKAIEDFNAFPDDYTKEFNKLFGYRSFANEFDGGVGDRIMMDRFIKDISSEGTQIRRSAEEFFNANKDSIMGSSGLSRLFSRSPAPQFDPSNEQFLSLFLASPEGMRALDSAFPDQLAALSAKTSPESEISNYRDVLSKEYAINYGERSISGNTADSVIKSLSKLIANPDEKGFVERAFIEGNTDEMFEAGEEIKSFKSQLLDLDNQDRPREMLFDRRLAEQREKYEPIKKGLNEIETLSDQLNNSIRTEIQARRDILKSNVEKRLEENKKFRKIDSGFAGRRKEQFKRVDRMIEDIRESTFGKTLLPRELDNVVAAFKETADSSDAINEFSLEYMFEQGRSHPLSILLDADFSSPQSLLQLYQKRITPITEGSVGLTLEQLNRRMPSDILDRLGDLQLELRSIVGPKYERVSQALRADGVTDGLANGEEVTRAIQERIKLAQDKKNFINAAQEIDPEFSQELLDQVFSNRTVAEMPYKDAVDVQRQLVQENLGNLLGDGYIMNHAMPTTRVSPDDLLQPGDHAIPKFITFPSGYKTLQKRPESGATIDKPLGFKFMDPGRDRAISHFMEDNPGVITIREDMTRLATKEQVPETVRHQKLSSEEMVDPSIPEDKKYETVKPKDVVVELTPEFRKKMAVAFSKAYNENYDAALKRAAASGQNVEEVISMYNPSDNFEVIRQRAMELMQEGGDAETYLRLARGGEVNIHKGIGGMAREVL